MKIFVKKMKNYEKSPKKKIVSHKFPKIKLFNFKNEKYSYSIGKLGLD